jgi:hypothetical protein
MDAILEVQTIHPKAVPTVSVIPKTAKIPATKKGYDPNPLFVKAKEKLPTTKVMISAPMVMADVSCKVKVAV